MVVPKQETDYIFDLEDTLLSEMVVFAKKIAWGIQKAVACKRVGMMVIGLEVPHAHIHLIPIQKEGDMSLANSRVELSKEQFEIIAANIRKHIF